MSGCGTLPGKMDVHHWSPHSFLSLTCWLQAPCPGRQLQQVSQTISGSGGYIVSLVMEVKLQAANGQDKCGSYLVLVSNHAGRFTSLDQLPFFRKDTLMLTYNGPHCYHSSLPSCFGVKHKAS